MTEVSYFMGTKLPTWRESDVKNITFVVTEDCNLVCKYCYMTGKNRFHKMNLETAKKAVDYILGNPDVFPEGSVVWEFIGGEPFLEIELIDEIADYIKTEMYRLKHKWFDNYRFSFSTNGILYGDPRVQKFIKKNHNNISVGISIDGNKLKHDQQRIKPDGSGSYDDIMKNLPLWLEQFPNASTKATFASTDLPLLKDSIISLYELGIYNIAANVIFEDDWKEGDDLIFENQLKELADYIIDNQLWDQFNCTFFSDSLGFALDEESLKRNWCGAGKMLAIDHQGKFYPCVRFLDYSLENKDGYVLGDLEQGYDEDKLRPFLALDLIHQSPEECIDCQIASGCAWCQGYNYDAAEIDTVYQRATYICKMHQARVRANDYYWNRLREMSGKERANKGTRKDYIYFLLSNQSANHCTYDPSQLPEVEMSIDTLKAGLEFARKNFYNPVLLLPPSGLTEEQKELLKGLDPVLIHTSKVPTENYNNIVVYDNEVEQTQAGNNTILLVNRERIPQLSAMIMELFKKHGRVNLVLQDVTDITEPELAVYEKELEKVAHDLIEEYKKGKYLELNVLSDPLYLEKMANCNAGVDSFVLAPDGQFYICPAFYIDGTGESVGTPETGIDFSYQEFLTLDKSPVCTLCDAHQCRRCVYLNQKQTKEYLIPGKTQCVISHVERKAGKKYVSLLAEENLLRSFTKRTVEEIFPEIDYYDPLDLILTKRN